MKTVCLIPSLRLGGAERQLLLLASLLRDAGHEVEVLSYHRDLFYSDSLSESGLQYCLIEKKSGGTISLCRRIAAHLKDISCDNLIAFLPGACTKAVLVHKIYPGFRLIVSERNFSVRLHLADLVRFLLFSQADKVVCNNYSQENLIRAHIPFLRRKVLTICNCVDLDRFAPLDCRAALHGGRQIVVTARLCPRKNAAGLIRAVSMLKNDSLIPEFRVHWYGSGNEGRYYRKCLRMIRKASLQNVFFIHGADSDTAPIYQKADIFCLPSFYEGTSNSLAEALACGKAVAISNVGDNSRYVRDNVNGWLFNPSDPADIARALRQALLCESSRIASFGAAGRMTAEICLNPSKFIAGWLDCCK